MSSVQRYLRAEGVEQPCTPVPSLCHFPSLSHPHPRYLCFSSSSLFFGYQLATHTTPPPFFSSLPSLILLPTPSATTVLRALSMSMPWLHGTAGLARQSPALPRRDTSTRCRRRYRNASAITRMASWVRAEVYCGKNGQIKANSKTHNERKLTYLIKYHQRKTYI